MMRFVSMMATSVMTAFLVVFLPISSVSGQQVVQLATLDWPPYTSPTLPNEGETTRKLREILNSEGLDLKVDFFPWKRAVDIGRSDPRYTGYYPEYKNKSCFQSQAFDTSVVGFAYQKATHFDWSTIDSLKAYTIGIVDGYLNDSGPFDAAVSQKKLRVYSVNTDEINMRMLKSGRLDAIVIDTKVLRYFLRFWPEQWTQEVVIHPTALSEQTLHVCAQETPLGERIVKAIRKQALLQY